MKRISTRFAHAALLMSFSFIFASCAGGSSSPNVNPGGALPQAPSNHSASPQQLLYVPNAQPFPTFGGIAGNTLVVFSASADGNVAPVQTIAGPHTGLNDPGGVQLDSRSNIYVANAACCDSNPVPPSITVYAPGATGDITPIRTIAGSATTLSDPSDVAFDGSDNLYVANFRGGPFPGVGTILEFAAAADGNVAPIVTIGGPHTGLSLPNALTLDGMGNIYVANFERGPCGPSGSVTVYAQGASGDIAPIFSIGGDKTGLNGPLGIALDSSGKIYVANQQNSVTVYAAGAHGNVAPIQKIDTPGFSPYGIALDSSGNIYVSGDRRVNVYAAGATGNATPIRVIGGSMTGLTAPTDVAIR